MKKITGAGHKPLAAGFAPGCGLQYLASFLAPPFMWAMDCAAASIQGFFVKILTEPTKDCLAMEPDEIRAAQLPIRALVSSLPLLVNKPHQALLRLHRQRGDMLTIKPPGFPPILFLGHPTIIRQVLLEARQYYTKARLYPLFRTGFGNGLIVSEGQEWKQQRQWLQPYMQKRYMGNFVNLVTGVALEKIEMWGKLSNGKINISQELLGITLEVIQRFLVNADLSSQIEAVRRNFIRAAKLSILGSSFTPPRIAHFQSSLDHLKASFKAEIKARQKSKQLGDDFLGFMMSSRDISKAGQINQLVDQLINMTFAGFETTAHGLTWACHLLSLNQDWETRLQSEVDHVLNGRPPRPDDIDQLSLAPQIMLESMRLYPPSWINARQANEEHKLRNLTVQTDTIVAYSAYVVHRDPRFWTKPEVFSPDRFRDGPDKYERQFNYLAFGGGTRRCIGKHFALLVGTIVLSCLAQRYCLMPLSPGQIRIDASITLRPKKDLMLEIVPRF